MPVATPGLASIGYGIIGAIQGVYTIAEFAAVVMGLFVVAVAGVFTIRSNVAKIWREQAEAEKARNTDLSEQLAAERKLKDAAVLELAAAKKLADVTPIMGKLDEILTAVKS